MRAKRNLAFALAVLLAATAIAPSLAFAADAPGTVNFVVQFESNITLVAGIPDIYQPPYQVQVAATPYANGIYSLADLPENIKEIFYNARNGSGPNAANVVWRIQVSATKEVEYNFNETLEQNLLRAFGAGYIGMYLPDSNTPGVVITLKTGIPTPGFGHGNNSNARRELSVTFSTNNVAGIANMPFAIRGIAVTRQNQNRWTISSQYLSTAQEAAMQAASKPGYAIAWQFDGSQVFYDYAKTLQENLEAAYGSNALQSILSRNNPSVQLNAIATASGGTVTGSAQLGGAHVNSSTIRLIEQSSNIGASAYELAMRNIASAAFEAIATLIPGVNMSYDKTGLQTGQYYDFQSTPLVNGAKATNAASNVLTVRARPLRPATLSASARDNAALLTWSTVADCDGYAVYVSTSANGNYTLAQLVGGKGSSSASVRSLTQGKTYYFKVVSYKQVGSAKIPSVYTGVVSARPY
jgi:hypothetical protein